MAPHPELEAGAAHRPSREVRRVQRLSTTVVIGVDVGGTKTKAGAVAVAERALTSQVLLAEQILTPRQVAERFYDELARLVRRVAELCTSEGLIVLPLIGLAHPGRFLPDGRVARGTVPNLGPAPDAFDLLNPSAELSSRLGGQVFAENDAVAQMRAGLRALLEDPALGPRLRGQTVVYLGPGTGMGGGVARVAAEGAISPVTDGHLFDLAVPGFGDDLMTAEELFTGPVVASMVSEANRGLSRPIIPATGGRLSELWGRDALTDEQRAAAEQIVARLSDRFAAIIELVVSGRIVKVRIERTREGNVRRCADEPERAWSPEDKALVRQARRILFGGWLGTDGPLGERVRRGALNRLAAKGLGDVEIVRLPESSPDTGMLGAAGAIPTDVLSAALPA